MPHETKFGSLEHFAKGGIEVINDDARRTMSSRTSMKSPPRPSLTRKSQSVKI